MAELAVTDGMPPPADLPHGECICTRLDDGSIRVDQADPRILISAVLLAGIFLQAMPDVSLGPPPENRNGTPFWEGAVLTISGVNRRVIYRIGEYVPPRPRLHRRMAGLTVAEPAPAHSFGHPGSFPRRSRARYWLARHVNTAGFWLAEHDHERAAILLYRLSGMW